MNPEENPTEVKVKQTIRPFTEKAANESYLFHVSIRAWLAMLFSVTVCYMGLKALEVKEPLYSLAVASVGFYFGGQANKRALPNERS